MRTNIATAALAVVLVAGPSHAAGDMQWTTSRTGGSEIEVPVFMAEGFVRGLMSNGEDYGTAFEPERYPVQLRQYRSLDAKGTPFQRIRSVLAHDGSEVTYRFDTARVGAISGYSGDGKDIFYGMCRRSASTTVCFDATWPREMQSMMGPVVERIAKRFRQGG